MSLNLEGQSCPVCHAYLFDEDDVVYCPICGAPHHRACYEKTGKCALEELHGTEKQYDSGKASKKSAQSEEGAEDAGIFVCPHCLKKLEEDTPICPFCGRPRKGAFAVPVLQLTPSEYPDIEGIKASEIAEFVALNPHKYLPRFARLGAKKKASWNWTAFLFPEGWFFLRKMYGVGALIFTIFLSAQICMIPLMGAASNIADSQNMSVMQIATYLAENAQPFPLLLAFAASAVSLAARLYAAIFGDWIYKEHTVSKLKLAENANEDKALILAKYGGINIFLFIISVLAVTNLPQLVAGFIL